MPEKFSTPEVKVVRNTILGEEIFFAIDQADDYIQGYHVKGRFYEVEELLIMSSVFPKGGRFLDIGANTGNHSIFFGRIMGASHIQPIEVNPRILELLKTNIALNRLDTVCDLSSLGVGLHSERLSNVSVCFEESNIGGATISHTDGDIDLVKGDEILSCAFDLVKIDVEGSELNVLKGMERFVREFRPRIFVEVGNPNVTAFFRWSERMKYTVVDRFKRYKNNCNYLIAPS